MTDEALTRTGPSPLPPRIHVVNVGGAGMSAIATVLAQMGRTVTGSDVNETPFLPRLRTLGVDVVVDDHHPGAAIAGLIVTSTATPADHPDVVAGRAAGVPVVHRGVALESICAERAVMAVAGTHGKSTTAGMVATIFSVAGAAIGNDAGYLVGTTIGGLAANADWRTGPGFIVEADESDGTFLRVGATHAIVTNLEADHLAYWGTEDKLREGFATFVRSLPGTAVLCADDPGSAALVDDARDPVTYGTDATSDYVIDGIEAAGIGVSFTLTHATSGEAVPVTVPFAPGDHNARNAAGAIVLAQVGGVPMAAAADALSTFAGVARRFEVRGEASGIVFVDSYDHLPTEVAAAISAAASGPFRRVVCVFQPHRYTRTRDLAPTFADAFEAADVVGITDLYPAGEDPIPGVSGALVAEAVIAAHPGADVRFLGDLDRVAEWLLDTLEPGDCCLTLNAGDLTRIPDVVLDRLRRRGFQDGGGS